MMKATGQWGAIAAAVAMLGGGCLLEEVPEESATTEAELALEWQWNPPGPRQPPAIPWEEMSALQKHVAFFDFNGDGYITVLEDHRGLRALGIDPFSASAFALAINTALGTPTMGYPSLTVSLYGIPGGIHGSDTGIYDSEGNFVDAAFQSLFDTWDANGSDGLDPGELAQRAIVDADLWDLFGVTASVAEFGLLYAVAAEDGELSRDRMRDFYDGTLFYTLAEERADTPWWGWWY
jgi:peroxygenase